MMRVSSACFALAIATLPLAAGAQVVYDLLPDILPVQPARAVIGPRDWSIDIARMLAGVDASCRATDIGLHRIATNSVVRCVNGHIDGRGDLTFDSDGGTVMTATFRQGIVNGKARIVSEFGLGFEGTLRENVAEGPGVFTERSGTRVRGVFTAGTLSGKVQLDFPDGSHSEIVYANGGGDGPTVLTYADGTRFEYTMRGTNYVGPAVMRFADGSRLDLFYGPHSAHYKSGVWEDAIYRPAHGHPISGLFNPAKPDLQHWEMPPFPSLSRRLEEVGTVTLAFIVGADGTISDIKVHESSGSPRLDGAALTAAASWRYYPASVDGRDIPVRTLLALAFKLQKAPIGTAP